jgi:hypothetical protein
MKKSDYAKSLEWLKTNPALEALCAKYPNEWADVQQEICTIVETGSALHLKIYLEQLSIPPTLSGHSSGKRQDQFEAALLQFVRSRMAHESVKKLCLSTLAADTGVKKGKLRFNLLNGYLAQKLLFARAMERKPVSLFWFRLIWPLLWQRKRLMPLVQPRGIYCFYSRELIDALTAMIASRSALEIGAGDGTLTRFLKSHGVNLSATDNHSWNNAVTYPEWVIKLEAREALANYLPEVVICSWPPSQNDFEREVFNTPSVQLYIVIGSCYQFAFGNWKDYRQQTLFDFSEDKKLSRMVLPPELGAAVYLFKRKTLASQRPGQTQGNS